MCCFWAIFTHLSRKTTFLNTSMILKLKIAKSEFLEIVSCRGFSGSECARVGYISSSKSDPAGSDFELSKCVRAGHISRTKNPRVADFFASKSRSCRPRFRRVEICPCRTYFDLEISPCRRNFELPDLAPLKARNRGKNSNGKYKLKSKITHVKINSPKWRKSSNFWRFSPKIPKIWPPHVYFSPRISDFLAFVFSRAFCSFSIKFSLENLIENILSPSRDQNTKIQETRTPFPKNGPFLGHFGLITQFWGGAPKLDEQWVVRPKYNNFENFPIYPRINRDNLAFMAKFSRVF